MEETRKYIPRFHLFPPSGWMNDPNGLCQFRGIHHIYFQYTPENPLGGEKYWGHYETKDFIHYEFTGLFLKPDCEVDKDGAYSGCAYVEDGLLYLYYTGNVKKEGNYDYIYCGREGNTLLVTSKDGRQASSKMCLLKNEDYPEQLSNHVRDPKVFEEDGTYYMVLGARTKSDEGCTLLYTSKDKKKWEFAHFIRRSGFGYMWECPDLFRLDGVQYLSVSPQGLEAERYRYQNRYQSGYFRATKELLQYEDGLCDFTEWDYGFDFYAPQTYSDETGRRILIGWMGVPDAEYDHDPSIAEGWQHMLTMPRELHVDAKSKRIFQTPVREMMALRQEILYEGNGRGMSQTIKKGQGYECLFSDFEEGDFELLLNEGFRIAYNHAEKVCRFSFLDEKLGYGRTERRIQLCPDETLSELHLFVDTCCIEIYMNQGAYVFTSKYFKEPCRDSTLSVKGTANRVMVYLLSGFAITSETV